MKTEELNAKIDAYITNSWEQIVLDIAELVEIPSVEELDKAAPEQPFGPGPAKALRAALALSDRMGFSPTNCEGYIGFADVSGESDTQFGIIGHMDVVPAGTGWDFEPFALTRKDGYLVGRGTIDDKGPTVIALHAIRFLVDHYGGKLPYTVRFIFGTNEESGMQDVTYYRQHFADPAFVVTPDADFPVCYGEKGAFDGEITSLPLSADALILEFEGGMATNAVPSQASVLLRTSATNLIPTDRITVEAKGENTLLVATGIGGHASLPEGTINAIGLLVDYLLENNLCTEEERAFLELQHAIISAHDGSGVGIKSSDDAFGALTLIGGTVKITSDRRLVQTIDIRYPTSITHEEIAATFDAKARQIGAEFESTLSMLPFLIDKDSPIIQALLAGYNEVTGETAEPFTIGGGTYAREFSAGASFGPGRPWVKDPDWVGSEHSANEAISEESLKLALKIYIVTFDKIFTTVTL